MVRRAPFFRIGPGAEGSSVACEDYASERRLVIEPGTEGVELVVIACVNAVHCFRRIRVTRRMAGIGEEIREFWASG